MDPPSLSGELHLHHLQTELYKPVFGRQSSALTSKHSTGDAVNEIILTHIIQVGSDFLACVSQNLSTTLLLGPSPLIQFDTSVIC